MKERTAATLSFLRMMAIATAIAAVVYALPDAEAAPVPAVTTSCQTISNTAGLISAGSACISFVASGDVERRTDYGGIAGTVSLPNLGSGAVSVSTFTSEDSHGCDGLTLDADFTTTAIGSWYNFDAFATVNSTFDSCFVVLEVKVIVDPTVGANVQVASWRFLFQFAIDHPLTDLEDDSTSDGKLSNTVRFPGGADDPGMDFLALTLLWLGLTMYFLRLEQPKFIAAFVAFLGAIGHLIGVLPVSFLWSVLILLLAIWLEALAGDRIYEKWLNRKESDTK